MRIRVSSFILALAFLAVTSVHVAAQQRAETHDKYAATLWQRLQELKYSTWTVAKEKIDVGCGPCSGSLAKTYLNTVAAGAQTPLPYGSLLITEHFAAGSDKPAAVTVRYRFKEGYHSVSKDWYWAHYTADGTLVATVADKASPYAKPGFLVREEDGRLWVFRPDSASLAEFIKSGDLPKRVTRPAAGPAGITLMSDDAATIDAFVTAKAGFVTRLVDDRLWVFRTGSADFAAFEKDGELAKHVIRPGAGSNGMTIKAPDAETIEAYLTAKPGFVTQPVEGRLWVFRADSEELAEFQKNGELAKHVVMPSAGPGGVTLKAPDTETINAYLAAAEGFVTRLVDGRIWVFRAGCPELAEFEKSGELAKQVVRPGAGPLGMTIKAPDAETIELYLKVCAL
jgi:1,2-phenylacetyl-CoA epoxidase PaaB subunit